MKTQQRHAPSAVRGWPLILTLLASSILLAHDLAAADPNAIGLAPLLREQSSLNGAGVPVGQAEAPFETSTSFEVNPGFVGQPASLLTWISSSGTATSFPNAVGTESGHADLVANIFYGASAGIAPGLLHVRNYEAEHYIALAQTISSQPDMVVNNSWIFGVSSVLETTFDNYAATYNVLFVSGMNNAADTPPAPGSCYNGIGVGGTSGNSSVGPTSDGRAKPDIVVPGGDLVSFLTPAVSGAATLLLQAARRNDGGAGTAAIATNSTTIKALLLNGAVKPVGWTNGVTRPLDARWGSGELNIYNSWLQLRSGRSGRIATTTVNLNAAHPPTSDTANNSARGWDYNSASSAPATDSVSHYYIDLPTNSAAYIGNVTLAWKRAFGAGSAKNLDLFLYQIAGTNLVASSQSSVDNVEHLFATNLSAGRYNLQVVKRGGPTEAGSESFAMAWDFIAPKLSARRAGGNLTLSWPVSEAAMTLQSAPILGSPNQWQAVAATPFVTNGQNTVTIATSGGGMLYYRLFRP